MEACMSGVIVYICTYHRYHTTLPLALMSVITQTVKPDRIVIYDDNEEASAKDIREIPEYNAMLQIMAHKDIPYEVIYGLRKGQHYGHQVLQDKFPDRILFRVDDDVILEPDTLEKLLVHMDDPKVGAVGGEILTPSWDIRPRVATGKIENVYAEPNLQWGKISKVMEVDHLHCSFLYRSGIAEYNLGLSKKAHREETLFTYALTQKGYKNLVVPATSWHLKSEGGIRTPTPADKQLFDHDEKIFQSIIGLKDQTIVVLDNGMGDHLVFKHILPSIKNPVCFTCYPDIVPGRSIQEAKDMFGNLDQWNIYRWMDQHNWKDSLENAFRKMYV